MFFKSFSRNVKSFFLRQRGIEAQRQRGRLAIRLALCDSVENSVFSVVKKGTEAHRQRGTEVTNCLYFLAH